MESEMRMRLRYGLNQADEAAWHFALGPARERIWERFREIDTRIVRLFLFDKFAPDPTSDWPTFAAYVQAVLNVGATPMITFSKFRRPFGDPRAVRWFATQCADVVWSCLEHWGGEVVRDWRFCVWNEPNSTWITGGEMTFELYRRIYEEVALGIERWLRPYLGDRKLPIGGPAVEGFQPSWADWVWRFLDEIDPSLVGFLAWHRYGDWRAAGEAGAPSDGARHRAMMMAQTADFEVRARTIARLLRGSPIENICAELNTHSHSWPQVRAPFNQSIFGAAFYTSALLHLMRGGADAEMFWTGTDQGAGYGMLDGDANPTPVFHAKRLCAQYVRTGDWISFPAWEQSRAGEVDAVVARDEKGRRSALLVHRRDEVATYAVSQLDGDLADCRLLLKIDGATGNRVAKANHDGTITFHGFGVAVMTNSPSRTDEPSSDDRSP